MNADLSALDHRYRAKRTAQDKAEYATAIQGYRRPASLASRVMFAVAALVLLAAYVVVTS